MMKTNFIKTTILALTVLIGSACTKDDDNHPIDLEGDGVIVVNNLRIPDEVINHKGDYWERLFLFSLEENRIIPTQTEFYTENWDIGFRTFSSILHVNNAHDTLSDIVYQGPMVGQVLGALFDKSFEEVVLAPDPSENFYNKAMSPEGILNPNKEWYSWNGNLSNLGYLELYSGAGANQHLIPNRTFVFRTNKGHYVKLQMLGIFKDSPPFPTKESIPYYLSFRYFIQKDGSRNLDTSKKSSAKNQSDSF